MTGWRLQEAVLRHQVQQTKEETRNGKTNQTQ